MVNDKKSIEEKEVILTQIIDEFFAKKRAGEKPTIEEYRKKYPEYAEEIKKELEEELSWSAQFYMLKHIFPFASTEKETNKSWERFHTRMIWGTSEKSPLRTITGTIEAHISRTIQDIEIVVPDILMHILTPQKIIPAMLGKGETKNEIEIPIPDIKGVLKISIFRPDDRGNIQINVQPTIKEASIAKQIIPVIIKDRLKDVMLQRIPVRSGEIAPFELSANKDYSICIEVGKEKRIYAVPLKISEKNDLLPEG